MATDQLGEMLKSSGAERRGFRSDFKLALFVLLNLGDAVQELIVENADSTSKKVPIPLRRERLLTLQIPLR